MLEGTNSNETAPINTSVSHRPTNARSTTVLVMVVLICALLGTSGYFAFKHSQVKKELKAESAKLDEANKKLANLQRSVDPFTYSLSAAADRAQNAQFKNNARNIETALAQYYVDHDNQYPTNTKVEAGDIDALVVILKALGYLSSSSDLSHKLDAKYTSEESGKKFLMAWCLNGEYETSFGNGYNGTYQVTNGAVSSPDTSSSLVISNLSCKQAFVIFGPQ